MTRGTIAFIDYSKDVDKYMLRISNEFNGDMAPDMCMGEELAKQFKDVFFSRKSHDSKSDKMQKIVKHMNAVFEYDDYEDDGFVSWPLETDKDGKVFIDLSTVLYKNSNLIDYRNDPWSKYFHYSDFLYIVPICNVDCEIGFKSESSMIQLDKNRVDVFYFRKYVGFINSAGNFVENYKQRR